MPLSQKEIKALKLVRNSIAHGQQAPSVREVMRALGYSSPNSAMLVVNNLIKYGHLRRRKDGKLQLLKDFEQSNTNARTVDVPLVGSAPCGAPLLAQENIEAIMPVSEKLAKPPHTYFLLRAIGDSMNKKGISDGDLVLVRQQPAAYEGDVVVALIDDEATIKEFHPTNEAVVLKPVSKNPKHRPIILSEDFTVQGVVVKAIPKI